MWGLAPDAAVDMTVYESGIHPDDLPRVRSAIAACVDPSGDGRYDIEYRVIGHDDGVLRHIATSGRTTFSDGEAIGFIGAAIDVTEQRRTEAAIRASEAQFRSFAAHSSNLIWIVDTAAEKIIYRSAAFERIWGVPCEEGPTDVAEWMKNVHPTTNSRSITRLLASGRARSSSSNTASFGRLMAVSDGYATRAFRFPTRMPP
jgi:PAS domain S-box-containing protein